MSHLKAVQAQPKFPSEVTPVFAQKASSISVQALKNATYQIPEQGTVTLSDGQYQSGNLTVNLLEKPIAIADLNQDGTEDAAVILAVQTGGSGTFMYLAAVIASPLDQTFNNVDTYLLGDRVQIQNLSIKKGAVRVKMLKAKPTDPLCCPTDVVVEAYQLNNTQGTFAPISLSEQEKQQILIEDVPSPVLGDGDNVPTAPPIDEIQIKF
ncbi:MAG: hypothetical protein VKJ02_14240 [Snowella sp.]|nr:hypothetical protein [Snowella sp.]